MVFLHNVPPVVRQIPLLRLLVLPFGILIGAFEERFPVRVKDGKEKVAVLTGKPLLVGIERCVAVSRLLLQVCCIIVGGGIHVAVERVADDVVLHKALGVRVAALIDEIRNADSAEKERDGKNRQQNQRRDLRPELGL